MRNGTKQCYVFRIFLLFVIYLEFTREAKFLCSSFLFPNPIQNLQTLRYTRNKSQVSILRKEKNSSCCTNEQVGPKKYTPRTQYFSPSSSDGEINDMDYFDISSDTKSKQESRLKSFSSVSRRQLLLMATTATIFQQTSKTKLINPAYASSEVDRSSGELFSPKSVMLGGGGSDEARGKSSQSRSRSSSEEKKFFSNRNNQSIQFLYNTRFITYLSRFLLNFDPAARAWWEKETFDSNNQESSFASFAESVEVGLADYFIGPYGSYASVQAAKAGLSAAAPATSLQTFKNNNKNGLGNIFDANNKNGDISAKDKQNGRKGILNLLALLQARYTSKDAKIQLAILFSFISDPELQPTAQISALLGELDDASVETIRLRDDPDDSNVNKVPIANNDYINKNQQLIKYGGYSSTQNPKITISPPPALGSDYKCARAVPIMRPTSRILKIKVTDGGSGYTSAPAVAISNGKYFPSDSSFQPCQAAAILDREGSVESIVVLNPGFGYNTASISNGVKIAPPSIAGKKISKGKARTATATAELEYQIADIKVVDGGNGYLSCNLPTISVQIDPPEEDPDWYISSAKYIAAEVSSKRDYKKNLFFANNTESNGLSNLENDIYKKRLSYMMADLKSDPTQLLPNAMRPGLFPLSSNSLSTSKLNGGGESEKMYKIPQLLSLETSEKSQSSPLYRAVDPLFGVIGFAPVTKRATTLSVSEYTRLALSGAICTVLVRTLLNPLELVKTKIQLKNDDDLLTYAQNMTKKKLAIKNDNGESNFQLSNSSSTMKAKHHHTEYKEDKKSNATSYDTTTLDAIQSIIELRGPQALFQSADVTFLASLVFGSLGFGATELFRRSFTATFVEGGDGESEWILLLAAAAATVMTSFAASPFEMMRVRSMNLIDPKPFTAVLSDFLVENEKKSLANKEKEEQNNLPSNSTRTWLDITWSDLPPLYAGFTPIVSRELPFAVAKFLAFDTVAKILVTIVNSQLGTGVIPVQVGEGTVGLAISAFSGALAGIAGACVSHPADLILTLTSASNQRKNEGKEENHDDSRSKIVKKETKGSTENDWRPIVQELLRRDGGVKNLFVGLPARSTFFFLVIGLQFFLYDYAKNLFSVGSDDLTLVLDVFYAVRQGLVEMDYNS